MSQMALVPYEESFEHRRFDKFHDYFEIKYLIKIKQFIHT